jgi:hypothetical protein
MALQEPLVPWDLVLLKRIAQLRAPSPISQSSSALVALVESSAPAARALGLVVDRLVRQAPVAQVSPIHVI